MRQKTISRFHPNDINFVNEDLFVVRWSRIVTCEKKCELDSRCYTEFGHVFAPPGDDRRTHKEPRVQEAQGPGRQPRRDQLPHPPRRHRLRDADENHRGDGRVLRVGCLLRRVEVKHMQVGAYVQVHSITCPTI